MRKAAERSSAAKLRSFLRSSEKFDFEIFATALFFIALEEFSIFSVELERECARKFEASVELLKLKLKTFVPKS